ncbi:TPA: hypothetical protein N0F65_005481, partial [Lagenidium giganteum]
MPVDLRSAAYGDELDKAVQFITTITGNGKGYRGDVNNDKPQHNRRPGPRREHGEANSASGRTFRPRKCYFCDQEGHIAADCAAKKAYLGSQLPPGGSANMAQGHSQPIDDATFDPSAYAACWMVEGTATAPVKSHQPAWILDSGASHHICGSATKLINPSPCELVVTVADGRKINATTKGEWSNRSSTTESVDLIHGLSKNLLSVPKLAHRGIRCDFNSQGATLQRTNKEGPIVGHARWSAGLCVLDVSDVLPSTPRTPDANANLARHTYDDMTSWHRRLGHINVDDIARIENHHLADGVQVTNRDFNDCTA